MLHVLNNLDGNSKFSAFSSWVTTLMLKVDEKKAAAVKAFVYNQDFHKFIVEASIKNPGSFFLLDITRLPKTFNDHNVKIVMRAT